MADEKKKLAIPTWSFAAAIVAVLAVAGFFYATSNPGEASREELTKIRQNQANFSNMNPNPAPPADGSGRPAGPSGMASGMSSPNSPYNQAGR